MVNAQLLEAKIAGSGKKKAYLAKCLGCSATTLRNKIRGVYPFNTDEAVILCKELGISKASEKDAIFFAHEVGR